MSETEEKKPTPQFCVTCKWLNYEPEAKICECRRNAPTRNLENTKCCFPPVNFMTWCGMWECALPEDLQTRKALIRAQEGK
jgi:hypothetical protein